jgi:hypothetical protein
LDKVAAKNAELDAQVQNSSVKEHEIVVVSALIEEKARLADEKKQLKRQCIEEKQRLDADLERAKVRRGQLEDEEHAKILKDIDDEYNAANEAVVDQKKTIATVNREVTILQRKIENCPSNIEITQFHKRLVELFDNLNTRTVEEKKYYALYNTVQEVKKLFSN